MTTDGDSTAARAVLAVVDADGVHVLAPAGTDAPERRTRKLPAGRLRPGDRLGSGYVVLTVGPLTVQGVEHVSVVAVGNGARWRYTWSRTLPVLVYRHPDDDR
jgi:hypothetical protein